MTVLGRDTSERLVDCAAVQGFVRRVCFKTGPPGLVGTELEWIVAFADDPTRPVPLSLLRDLLDAAGPPPRGSRVTYEPGGQLELSSPAFPGPTACWQALTEDADHARRALAPAGLVLLDTAIDPFRPPQRQLVHPRYDAMEAYFAAAGPDSAATGPVMMTGTAALQVNLDIGEDMDEAIRRWRLLHGSAPTMVATFANSPVHAGRATGWKSGRQQVWQRLDLERTTMPTGTDPARAWAQYALDAHLMLRRRDGDDWRVEHGTTFRDWVTSEDPPRRGRPAAAPDDAVPARPSPRLVRGALPRHPAVAVVAGADGGADGAGRGRRGVRGRVGRLRRARRLGRRRPGRPGRPGLQAAALAASTPPSTRCGGRGEDPGLVDLVAAFRDEYVARGRSPADDPLDGLVEAHDHPPRHVARRAVRARPQGVRRRRAGARPRPRLGLTTGVLDETELLAQHSRLMSPLVWDLAHVGNYEELWLLRAAAGIDAMRPEIDDIYDAFEHPRADRPDAAAAAPGRGRRLHRPGAPEGARRSRRVRLDAAGRAAGPRFRLRHGPAARAPARRDDAGHPPAAARRPGASRPPTRARPRAR